MRPVTVVTAYFNIGRERFKAAPRTESVYFEQFAFWARMRNPLVVYTEAESVEQILAVRERFGLREATEIVVVDDLWAVEPDIYGAMTEIASNKFFRDFRVMPEATSGIANYSYLMLMKTWFIADAATRGLTGETVAWVDFGFNHGGLVFSHAEEFDFEWTAERPERVTMFLMQEYDDRPIFEIVRRLSDCLMGSPFFLPASRAGELWEVNRRSMQMLNVMGFIDDDQLVQLLSQRLEPELFDLRPSSWFRPMKDVAAPHLTMREEVVRPWYLEAARSGLHRWRRHKRALATSRRLYRNLLDGRP